MEPFIFCVMQVATIFIFILLLVSWVVPDHFPPWLSFHSELPSFIAAYLALGLSLYGGGRVVKLPSFTALTLALAISVVCQWLFGMIPYGGDALLVLVYLITFWAAWLGGHRLVLMGRGSQMLEGICSFLAAAGFLTAFQVLAQWLQLESAMHGWVIDGLLNGRPRGNVGQPNHAATVLLMGVVGAVVLRSRQCIRPLIMWCSVVLTSAGVVLTQSRTGLLSAMALCGAYLWFAKSRKELVLGRQSAVVWVAVLYFSAWQFSHLESQTAAAALNTSQMVHVGSRPLIWKQILFGLFERPWTGWGWLQIPSAQQFGALTFPGTEQTAYAHNIIIDILSFIGIPAAFVVLAATCTWYSKRVKGIWLSNEAISGCFLLIPFLMHSLLEYPHAYAYFLIPVGIILGCIDAWSVGAVTGVISVRKWLVVGSILIWLPVLGAILREYIQAEEDFRVNRFENRNIGYTPDEYIIPNMQLLTQLGALSKAMRLRAEPNMKPEDVELLLSVSRRYTWAPLQFRTALALGLNGQHRASAHQLLIIKSMFASDIYAEAKDNFIELRDVRYPELKHVDIP